MTTVRHNGETWRMIECCGAGDWLGMVCPQTGRVIDVGDFVFYCRATGDWMSEHAMSLAIAYDPTRA